MIWYTLFEFRQRRCRMLTIRDRDTKAMGHTHGPDLRILMELECRAADDEKQVWKLLELSGSA